MRNEVTISMSKLFPLEVYPLTLKYKWLLGKRAYVIPRQIELWIMLQYHTCIIETTDK